MVNIYNDYIYPTINAYKVTPKLQVSMLYPE